MRMRLLLLLVAVACVAPGRAAGQDREPWRTDWRAFWEAVAPHARAGSIETNRDAIPFNQVFAGEVEWTGIVRSLRSTFGGGVDVELDMPPVLVPLRDGSSLQVRRLSLSCWGREGECGRWSRDLVGRQVRFRTTLVNRTRGNRPVVRAERTGKQRWIDIQTHGAELVEAAG